VKCRGNGFGRLYDWLEGNDFLIVRADRAEPLVIIPLKLAAEVAAAEPAIVTWGPSPFLGTHSKAPRHSGQDRAGASLGTSQWDEPSDRRLIF
jgi:hypothetical protein